MLNRGWSDSDTFGINAYKLSDLEEVEQAKCAPV